MAFADVDVSQWVCDVRYSFEDICTRLGIDVNDDMIRYLINMDVMAEHIMDEVHLDLMGLPGLSFKDKHKAFKKLLRANPDIPYTRIRDGHILNRKYYVVRGWDFEALFMQVPGPMGDRFRQQSQLLRQAFKKYWQYKDMYFTARQNASLL